MSDYSSLGAFSTGGASALSGDLIQQLYDADTVSIVDPITEEIELIATETEVMENINTLVNELIDSIEIFDLYYAGNNVFEQVSASATGESALFDAADVGALKEGTISVKIDQIAQKDAYQTNTFTSSSDLIGDGTITINGNDYSTNGATYEEFIDTLNYSGYLDASLAQVSDTEYRIVVKTLDPGQDNALTITQTGVDLGLDDANNHVLTAQNLMATVDGVDYDISSNKITLDGNLTITASTTGESSISVENDTSSIIPAIEEFAEKYNELVLAVEEEIYSETPSVDDTSSLRSLVSGIKEMMFGEYGLNDQNVLNYGFEFDEYGALSIDTTVLGEALTDDPDGLEGLFVGVAEDEGFGTAMKSYLDSLNASDGIFSLLESSRDTRLDTLEEEKEDAIETLDNKYDAMAVQFAAYAAIITQLETSFSSLGLEISQSSSDS